MEGVHLSWHSFQALEDLMFRCDEETILNAELKEKIEELEKGKHIKEVSVISAGFNYFTLKICGGENNFKN